ncbi:MAG TPA: hypothetical protein VFN47_10090 [Pedococcus sp.]|nr:hypothetical protein [Pedococcus sp.]
MSEPRTTTQTPTRSATSPAQWAVLVVVALAAWEAGRLLAGWLMMWLAPGWAHVIGAGGGAQLRSLLTLLVQIGLSVLIAAPLAYAGARAVSRRL